MVSSFFFSLWYVDRFLSSVVLFVIWYHNRISLDPILSLILLPFIDRGPLLSEVAIRVNASSGLIWMLERYCGRMTVYEGERGLAVRMISYATDSLSMGADDRLNPFPERLAIE